MTRNTLTKLIVISLILISALSLLPNGIQAAEQSSKCFAQFEKCMNEVRVGFFSSFIDALDCELELAACIKKALGL
ncbi:MAG: hypothetical protein H5U06_08730 [Candidatus Aminicenantes bacterium]|nr:hypothetical protein [Candidatus Aminicenantes bacterium]